jgi:histone-lysine N-methyltransferase SETMAR
MTQQREFASALAKTQHPAKQIHTVARGKTVNGEYIIEVMKRFLKVFKRKRPEIAASPWLFHWVNAPVHTANNVTKFLAKNNIRTFQHPPYSPDLAPADYFLFRRLKSDLAVKKS